jgi:GT2 family glycosyltransferase
VGFNGQLDVLLLRLVSLRQGPRVIFAPLVSLTETLVDDRGVYSRGGLAARALRLLDRLSCRAADVVVVDTLAHRRYFVDVLGVAEERVVVCYLGADAAVFGDDADSIVTEQPDEAEQPDEVGRLRVLWFGQYLPLHGTDVIAGAVEQLADRDDLSFVFVGTGEARAEFEQRVRQSGAVAEFEDWVDYEQLPALIEKADIVLGVFGDSVKSRMVIPNKVYQGAAVGRAVITADCEAVREVFTDGRDLVLCEAEAGALASAISSLASTAGHRRSLGEAAAELIAGRFGDRELGRCWAGPLSGEEATAEQTAVEVTAVGEPAAIESTADDEALVGVVILNFNSARATLRCLLAVTGSDYGNLRVMVVDNASQAADRRELEAGMAGRFEARLLLNDENLGYAGGNNAALKTLFGDGCRYVLVLNGDTLPTPTAISSLVACARRNPHCGPVGPRIARDWPGAHSASIGERYWATVAWLPRSLVRPRRPRQTSYEVGGVLGCAMLISRDLYNRVGGFEEAYFAYYEEVDYCLRARRVGMPPRVEPGAEIAHTGWRGFGGGMTGLAAYLKARNLWQLGSRRLDLLEKLVFVPGYFAMLGLSMLGYLFRGRISVLVAMGRGAAAGIGGETGRPPDFVFEAAGVPDAGRLAGGGGEQQEPLR